MKPQVSPPRPQGSSSSAGYNIHARAARRIPAKPQGFSAKIQTFARKSTLFHGKTFP
jgi:hypothetical protein